VPINTSAFASVPPGKNNAASGLINLSRNIGGSVGISLATTWLARRSQYHQNVLSTYLNSSNLQFQNEHQALTQKLIARGMDAVTAAQQADGLLYNTLIKHSTMLAYVDSYYLLAVVPMCLVPLVFIMKRVKAAAGAAAH